MSTDSPPALSVVCSGRNDNWNGSFDRVAPFVMAHNAKILARHTNAFEQVFVEWAPLEDRPLLSERLVKIGPQVRCFVVPKAIHDGFKPGIAFLQYHARNVGIRRATGRIIIATNADILLTDAIVEQCLSLRPGQCLRAPRHDIALDVIEQSSAAAVEAFCADESRSVAVHPIVRHYGKIKVDWLENAAGDFAALPAKDWQQVGGWHERVDASMGVDAELIGQAKRLDIKLIASPHPVYHADHPEQQTGRLHMPPFSRRGYDNPADWGLGVTEFEPIGDQISRCSAALAGTFNRVGWPPPLAWREAFDGMAVLHDRRLAHHVDNVVFCGLNDALIGFAQFLDLTPGQSWFHDDDKPETRDWADKLGWPEWPILRVAEDTLYVVLRGDKTEGRLVQRGARPGHELLVVDPGEIVTYSALQAALSACASDWRTLVLYGYGHHGRSIARWLREQKQLASQVLICDDGPAVRVKADLAGHELIHVEELTGARSGQMIIIASGPEWVGPILQNRLKGAGLVEWQDWIACPFSQPDGRPPKVAEQAHTAW